MPHTVAAELVGNVAQVMVSVGDSVTPTDTLVILESMKMEIPVLAEVTGTVGEVAVSAGIGTVLPIYVKQASGGIVLDVDCNQLIDFGSGIAVVSVGNAAPRVVSAVQDQVADFTHTCFMVTPYEEYVRVAETLNELTPGTHEKRSALFNSGAEAVENAVKIARHYTGRPAVVAFDHAYHGRTNLTMALTAKNMPYKHRFGPFAGEVYRAPMAYPFRWPGGPEACAD